MENGLKYSLIISLKQLCRNEIEIIPLFVNTNVHGFIKQMLILNLIKFH